MNITKENTVYCDVLKIELATTDTSTGYKPGGLYVHETSCGIFVGHH